MRLYEALLSLSLLASALAEGDCGCASSRALSSLEEGDGSCTAPSRAALSTQEVAIDGAGEVAPPPPAPFVVPPRVIRLPLGSTTIGTSTPHFVEDGEGNPFKWTLSSPLWADAYEVSNERFAAFVRATGYVSESEVFGWSFAHELALPEVTRSSITQSAQGAEWWLPTPNASWRTPEGIHGGDVLTDGRASHPAVHMSKRDGDAFCAWAGGRLPSEAEWEYAARGGKQKMRFPWGNKLTRNVTKKEGDGGGDGEEGGVGRFHANIWQGTFPGHNTGADGFLWTAPVDAFGPQNAWGLFNVMGNVWEWTSETWCPPKGTTPLRPPPPDCSRRTAKDFAREAGDAGEVDFIKKGGSFMCHKSSCYRYRSAARHKNSANSGAQNLGFRCFYDASPAGVEEAAP